MTYFTCCNILRLPSTFTPICMHELNWNEEEATFYVGLMYMSGSLIAIVCFVATKYLMKM